MLQNTPQLEVSSLLVCRVVLCDAPILCGAIHELQVCVLASELYTLPRGDKEWLISALPIIWSQLMQKDCYFWDQKEVVI